MKAELKKLKSEIKRKEDLLYLDTLLTEDMNSLINDWARKIQQFQNMQLMEAPLEVPSDEEDTKLNVKSSRVLMHPPKTIHKPKIFDEESKKVILKVLSLSVKKLLTSENDVGYMVHQANATFIYLKVFKIDYASFHREVT
ncbi:hypothetical protein RND71_016740 [Anisodus tanguticus]|uniref:Uncharacterized protein n=1 Tax=Anisodus tanguticus TaxID=243964 RepID=A0AAE1S944_9SOLA|nr:hypothetical protein RND71_016740 [Anisodus tanguticus]